MFDEFKRTPLLEERVERDGVFTDVLSAPDWPLRTADLCLICLGVRAIKYAALSKRGKHVATMKFQVRFSDFVAFEPPIGFDEIESQLTDQFQQYFLRVSSGDGSRVPPKTWSNLLTSIKALRPQYANSLDHLDRLRQEAQRAEVGAGFDIMAQEKDAVGLAFDISGFDRAREFSRWDLADIGKPTPSFFRGGGAQTGANDFQSHGYPTGY